MTAAPTRPILHDQRCCSACTGFAFEAHGETFDARRIEQSPQRHTRIEGGTEPRHDLGGHQRVAAESEEVVVETHLFDSEHVGEDRRDGTLGIADGGTELPFPDLRGGQRLRSSFPDALSGRESSTTNCVGTMYDGNSSPSTPRRCAGSMSPAGAM